MRDTRKILKKCQIARKQAEPLLLFQGDPNTPGAVCNYAEARALAERLIELSVLLESLCSDAERSQGGYTEEWL